MKMQVAANLMIDLTEPPYDTQGLRVFIAGISGAGKSYAQMKFLEEAHDAGLQFVLLDVHGEGHVLAELSDHVVVASERFGIPVTIEAVDIYVEIVESGMSLVIDLKSLYWQARDEFLEFTHLFLRRFMAKWATIMRPVLLAMDEAQEIAPQTQTKGSSDLVKVVSEIITGGRKSGVHSLLASQRPAKIDKTAISQANVRLIGQLTATQDWNAVKEYTQGFSFRDLRGFRSGDFICAAEGSAEKIHILKRRTKDAGETPNIEARFSTVQKRDMKDIADRIAAAILASKKDQEQEKKQSDQIKSLEKRLEDRDEKIKHLEAKLDTVEFVASKLGQPKENGRVEVPQEFVDVKAEFEREIKKLNAQMQKQLADRDSTIESLMKESVELHNIADMYESMRTAFLEFLGVSNISSSAGATSTNINEVVDRVLARIGPLGTAYEVAPLEALKLEEEKRTQENIIIMIDALSTNAFKILRYLIAAGQQNKTTICRAIWNQDGGAAFKAMDEAIRELNAKKLVFRNQMGYGSRISQVVKEYLNGLVENSEPLEQHIIEHIRTKDMEVK